MRVGVGVARHTKSRGGVLVVDGLLTAPFGLAEELYLLASPSAPVLEVGPSLLNLLHLLPIFPA